MEHRHQIGTAQRGFTLIELLVALLVVAALMAIGIPTFAGFQDRARDRSVQVHLRSGLVLERAYWQDTGSYTALTSDLAAYDGTANFFAFPDLFDHPLPLLDLTSNGQRVCLLARSDSGEWFGIFDDSTTGKTWYGGIPFPCTTALTATFVEGGW